MSSKEMVLAIIAIFMALSCPSLHAEEAPDIGAGSGFIRIINAINRGTGNVSIRVDDGDIYPPGYKLGAVTGGIGLKPGGHRVSFRRDGVTTGSTQVTLEKGVTLTLICYSENVTTPDGQAARPKVKILRLKPKDPENGKVATFVSVSASPELRVDLRRPDKKWQESRVKRLETSELPIMQARGYVALRSGGRPLDAIPVAEDGNYVVVLFDDTEGKLRSVNFRDTGVLTSD